MKRMTQGSSSVSKQEKPGTEKDKDLQATKVILRSF